MLRIRANQVALMDDESLHFEPRFFRPYHKKILPICYFDALQDEDDRPRNDGSNTLPENPFPNHPFPTNPRPEFEAILQEAQKREPDGDYLSSANHRYHFDLEQWCGRETEMDLCARELWNYLDYFLDISLEDQSDPMADHSLRDLEKLEHWESRRSLKFVPLVQIKGSHFMRYGLSCT